MSAEAVRIPREFRLDDERWRWSKERAHRVTRWAPALLVASIASLAVAIVTWGFPLPRDVFLAFFGFGFAFSAMAFVIRPNDPVRMVLGPRMIEFYRASGKRVELPLDPGVKVGLYDSTPLLPGGTFVLRFGRGGPPRGSYLLLYGRSLRNEPFELTKEAFDALRQELVAREATVLRDGPISSGSTTTLTEYRLPRNRT